VEAVTWRQRKAASHHPGRRQANATRRPQQAPHNTDTSQAQPITPHPSRSHPIREGPSSGPGHALTPRTHAPPPAQRAPPPAPWRAPRLGRRAPPPPPRPRRPPGHVRLRLARARARAEASAARGGLRHGRHPHGASHRFPGHVPRGARRGRRLRRGARRGGRLRRHPPLHRGLGARQAAPRVRGHRALRAGGPRPPPDHARSVRWRRQPPLHPACLAAAACCDFVVCDCLRLCPGYAGASELCGFLDAKQIRSVLAASTSWKMELLPVLMLVSRSISTC
jgi:hypothetical protein